MVVKGGVPTVGHGPLPEDVYGPADAKTIGEYAAVLPVGRTVAANDTDEDKAAQAEYSGAAFAAELTPPGACRPQLPHADQRESVTLTRSAAVGRSRSLAQESGTSCESSDGRHTGCCCL